MSRAAWALGLAAAVAGPARADTPVDRPEAIEVDRVTPPPGRVEFGFDGGAPVGAWAIGLQLGSLDTPIVLRAGPLRVPAVARRETAALGGALALGPSIVLDARLPLSHQTGARWQGLGDDRPLARWVAGDLELGARLRVAAPGRLAVFLRGDLTLPTGADHDFAGEAAWTAAWRLIARAALPHDVVLAATGGILLRGAEVQVADRVVGDELHAAIGATVGLPPALRLWCHPDQLRLAAELDAIVGDSVAGQRGPSPVEAAIGVIGRPRPSLAIGARIGAGIGDQIGAPALRAMLEVAWQAPAPPPRAAPPAASDDDDDAD